MEEKKESNEEEPKCRCEGCGKVFPISKIVYGIGPAEYGGGHICFEASPCCHKGFQIFE